MNYYYLKLSPYFGNYLLILSGFLILISAIGLIFPLKTFQKWEKWTESRFFRLHGAALIAGGFPLLNYRGTITGTALFIVGLIVIFTGPFIIIFPELFRKALDTTKDDFTENDKKAIVYTDSIIRILISALMIYVILSEK
ncbi:MAG TPA: hypothetical protein PLV17_12170 [Spirochaetota bacterium]|nr:hypothetical protein [Spirochaetota bacterium]